MLLESTAKRNFDPECKKTFSTAPVKTRSRLFLDYVGFRR